MYARPLFVVVGILGPVLALFPTLPVYFGLQLGIIWRGGYTLRHE
jgi:hypothetical protein